MTKCARDESSCAWASGFGVMDTAGVCNCGMPKKSGLWVDFSMFSFCGLDPLNFLVYLCGHKKSLSGSQVMLYGLCFCYKMSEGGFEVCIV